MCGDANSRLRAGAGFAATYGRNVRTVSEQQSKHMREEQVLSKDGSRCSVEPSLAEAYKGGVRVHYRKASRARS